jgi:hypothetical protein
MSFIAEPIEAVEPVGELVAGCLPDMDMPVIEVWEPADGALEAPQAISSAAQVRPTASASRLGRWVVDSRTAAKRRTDRRLTSTMGLPGHH